MKGNNPFLQQLDHRNNKLMLLTGALLVITTNTTILGLDRSPILGLDPNPRIGSESDLTVVQNFLDRCYKRRFISFPVSIKNLLIKQDRNILKKLRSTNCHPLKYIIPVQKTYVHNLRKKGCARPKINTERFMNTFVNRLIFKLHLL